MQCLLYFLVLASSCVSQELLPFGPQWIIADPILNILERDKAYFLQQGPQRSHTMHVRRFYGEEDPFHEIFRIMNTIFNESENVFNQTLLRINDISNFEQHMNMKCEPTVTEGKWYRIKGIHCVSNNDTPTPLQELITPSPSPSSSSSPVLKLDMKKHSTTFPVLTIVLTVVVLLVFCALIVYSYYLLKQKRLRDNRITVSPSCTLPNYGTFN